MVFVFVFVFAFPNFLFLSFQSIFCLCKVFDLSLPDFFPDLLATKRVAVERESSLLVQENTSRWRRWPFKFLISMLNRIVNWLINCLF